MSVFEISKHVESKSELFSVHKMSFYKILKKVNKFVKAINKNFKDWRDFLNLF